MSEDEVPVHPLLAGATLNTLVTKENLEEAQRLDPTFMALYKKASPENNILIFPAYHYRGNILMRFHRPPKLTDGDTWTETYQVVVPQTIRIPVLEIAHEGSGVISKLRKLT